MLTTNDLRTLTNQLPNSLGVYSINTLPDLWQLHPQQHKNKTLITNTDMAQLPGTHWVSVYVDDAAKMEVFDSYGLPPPPQLQAWEAGTQGNALGIITRCKN